ncbi:MAG: hypothetical protein NTZ32_15070 [Planctomycetales bacterium]|nr:hypothetical protein [Planctomycetales bacterium]
MTAGDVVLPSSQREWTFGETRVNFGRAAFLTCLNQGDRLHVFLYVGGSVLYREGLELQPSEQDLNSLVKSLVKRPVDARIADSMIASLPSSSADPQHLVDEKVRTVVTFHPRTRVTEAEIDQQVLAIFDKMRIENEYIREWGLAVLRSQTKDTQADSLAQRAELNRQLTLTVSQQNRHADMRISQEIDADLFAAKQTGLRDRIAGLKLQLDVVDRSHEEMCDLAVKVFELSQSLRQKWLTADCATKRRILEIVF